MAILDSEISLDLPFKMACHYFSDKKQKDNNFINAETAEFLQPCHDLNGYLTDLFETLSQ